MRFYLQKEHRLTSFTSVKVINDDLVKCYLVPVTPLPEQRGTLSRKTMARLDHLLDDYFGYPEREHYHYWNLELEFGISRILQDGDNNFRGYVKLFGKPSGKDILDGIKVISDNQAKVNICLSFEGGQKEYIVSTRELPIRRRRCHDRAVGFPRAADIDWEARHLATRCTIVLTIPQDKIDARFTMFDPPSPNFTQLKNRKLLEEGTLSDVTLVSSNGVGISAHKAFLASDSPVFLAMFQSDMSESRDCVVKLPDMSEGGVRAMLNYLYCHEVQDEKLSHSILFEMFHAGHKYGIDALQETMREKILKRSVERFNVDGAVELFMFARNVVPVDEELKEKAVLVLKRFSTRLEESPAFKELFMKDGIAAMELCRCALAT